MKNNLIVLLGLVSVILLSGCIGGGESTIRGYPGAIITDFSPIASSIRAGSPVNLYITVQNQGYEDATDANVVLFNCGPINTGDSTGIPGTSASGDYTCNKNISSKPFTLAKPDPSLNIVGEVKEAEISLPTTASMFPEGRTSQTFTARLTYDYKATASRDIFFTTFANWKEKGGAVTSGPLNEFSTPATISLSINAPSDLIILTAPDTQQEFTVGLSIRNTGGGFVKDKALKEIKLCYDKDFVVPIKDTGTGMYGNFDKIESGIESDCLVIINKENLMLIGLTNQYKDLSARFMNKKDAIQVQDITGFDAEIAYTYMIDRSTSISVLNG